VVVKVGINQTPFVKLMVDYLQVTGDLSIEKRKFRRQETAHGDKHRHRLGDQSRGYARWAGPRRDCMHLLARNVLAGDGQF
jgi:hypothetical protein